MGENHGVRHEAAGEKGGMSTAVGRDSEKGFKEPAQAIGRAGRETARRSFLMRYMLSAQPGSDVEVSRAELFRVGSQRSPLPATKRKWGRIRSQVVFEDRVNIKVDNIRCERMRKPNLSASRDIDEQWRSEPVIAPIAL